jgi:hypothetical protein
MLLRGCEVIKPGLHLGTKVVAPAALVLLGLSDDLKKCELLGHGVPSVIFSEHDGQDAQGLIRIARVFGAEVRIVLVMVINLPKELLAIELE